jgi:hypothetical protein
VNYSGLPLCVRKYACRITPQYPLDTIIENLASCLKECLSSRHTCKTLGVILKKKLVSLNSRHSTYELSSWDQALVILFALDLYITALHRNSELHQFSAGSTDDILDFRFAN